MADTNYLNVRWRASSYTLVHSSIADIYVCMCVRVTNTGSELYIHLPPIVGVSILVAPSAAPPQAASLTLTNTRQIGVKHHISLKKSGRGYGLGLTSRDVHTDQKGQPVYVKSIHQGSSAYQDGRLRIGDRILEVSLSL